ALSNGTVTIQTSGEAYTYFDEAANATAEAADSRSFTFTIDQGFVEVLNNEVNLLVQGARNIR
ncbi:MAG: hypothetical protein AAF840_04305, partial [Bacteroidota bacterium]